MGAAGEGARGAALYVEGMDAYDIDGDGRPDLLAGNDWFKYQGGNTFKPIKVGALPPPETKPPVEPRPDPALAKGIEPIVVGVTPSASVPPLSLPPVRAGDRQSHVNCGRGGAVVGDAGLNLDRGES